VGKAFRQGGVYQGAGKNYGKPVHAHRRAAAARRRANDTKAAKKTLLIFLIRMVRRIRISVTITPGGPPDESQLGKDDRFPNFCVRYEGANRHGWGSIHPLTDAIRKFATTPRRGIQFFGSIPNRRARCFIRRAANSGTRWIFREKNMDKN